MSAKELRREMEEGFFFYGYEEQGELALR